MNNIEIVKQFRTNHNVKTRISVHNKEYGSEHEEIFNIDIECGFGNLKNFIDLLDKNNFKYFVSNATVKPPFIVDDDLNVLGQDKNGNYTVKGENV